MNEIRDLVEGVFVYAENLEKENEELKDLHWENDMLKKMKADRDLMEADYYRGFPITEKEAESIKKWEDKHWTEQHAAPNLETRLKKQGAIGGSYHYEFTPTSIGTIGAICCTSCQNKARQNAGDNRERYRELLKEYDAEFVFQNI